MSLKIQPKPDPWKDTVVSGLAKIRGSAAGPTQKQWYEAILRFLCDETRVVAGLKQLLADPGTASVNGFLRYLAAREAAAGFNSQVIRLNDLVEPDFFMHHVRAKRPLFDFGAGAEHGALTHRIQWVMVAELFPGTPTAGDVYASFARMNAYKLSKPSMWDVVLDGDSPIEAPNATSPEYLMRYMQHSSDPDLQRLHFYSGSLAQAN